MKIYSIILVLLFFISCGRNDYTEIESPTTPNVAKKYNMVFDNYEITDLNLYKGPFGDYRNVEESYISNYWSFYKEPETKNIVLDLENMTLQLVKEGSSNLTYNIKLKQDSIFILENNKEKYIGYFDKNFPSLKIKKYFKYTAKVSDSNQVFFFSKSQDLGFVNYNDVFLTNVFNSPADMTNAKDEVFWANVAYTFK